MLYHVYIVQPVYFSMHVFCVELHTHVQLGFEDTIILYFLNLTVFTDTVLVPTDKSVY